MTLLARPAAIYSNDRQTDRQTYIEQGNVISLLDRHRPDRKRKNLGDTQQCDLVGLLTKIRGDKHTDRKVISYASEIREDTQRDGQTQIHRYTDRQQGDRIP
jgi:hypothetical protein